MGRYQFQGPEYYIGEWKTGAAHGRGRHVYADGTLYEGGFRNNKPDGEGFMRHGNGSWHIGSYSEGLRHGKGVELIAGGGRYRGEWWKGKRTRDGFLSSLETGKIVKQTWWRGKHKHEAIHDPLQYATSAREGREMMSFRYESGTELFLFHNGAWAFAIVNHFLRRPGQHKVTVLHADPLSKTDRKTVVEEFDLTHLNHLVPESSRETLRAVLDAMETEAANRSLASVEQAEVAGFILDKQREAIRKQRDAAQAYIAQLMDAKGGKH